MKKNLLIKTLALFTFLVINFTFSNAQIRITEVMSSSGDEGTDDWIELTNLGPDDVDITGWRMDDESYSFDVSVELLGVTSIPAGKSVVFIETKKPETTIPAFKSFWGVSLNDVAIGSYSGSGVGLGAKGDGVIIFDKDKTEIDRVSFGESATGSSFYWTHDSEFNVVDNGIISTEGTINGVKSNQQTLVSSDALGNIGSPGTAVIGGVLAGNSNVKIDANWRLTGKTLQFTEIPTSVVEVFSITGAKVKSYMPSSNINLDLNQGVYIVKVNKTAKKVVIR